MKTVGAVEARRQLGSLLNLVSLTSDSVVIERDGKPIARLSGIGVAVSDRSLKRDFREAAGLGADLWRSVDVENYIRKERESWD
jgi:antitoxin (DNA-binding transcriptional repressor) of toxin-antitoxin stability system